MFHVNAPLFKAGVITWLSGGTKIFPSKERNSRAASTSWGCAHCWDTTESTHNRAWHIQREITCFLNVKTNTLIRIKAKTWHHSRDQIRNGLEASQRVCVFRTRRKCVKTIKNIPEEWPGVLCFSLKHLILTEAAAKYSAAQSVSAPAVWQLTWVSYRQSYLCVCVVYVLTCSGLIRNHSRVTSRTVDSTCSSSGAEKPRTTTRRADSSAFWTEKRMHCVCKSTGLQKGKTPRCTESQVMMHLTSEAALTTLSTCASLYPPFSQSVRTFWARSIMSNSTRRRTSCESALRRICCHMVRFSTLDGGKRATSSIWKQRWFRRNTVYAEVLNVKLFSNS